jgi:hypothetical protein
VPALLSERGNVSLICCKLLKVSEMIIFDFNSTIFLQRINIILLSVLRYFQSGHFTSVFLTIILYLFMNLLCMHLEIMLSWFSYTNNIR